VQVLTAFSISLPVRSAVPWKRSVLRETIWALVSKSLNTRCVPSSIEATPFLYHAKGSCRSSSKASRGFIGVNTPRGASSAARDRGDALPVPREGVLPKLLEGLARIHRCEHAPGRIERRRLQLAERA